MKGLLRNERRGKAAARLFAVDGTVKLITDGLPVLGG